MNRKKEVFKSIKPNIVGLYCCGPTVYNYAHIGNLRSYIFEDILRRTLEYNNYTVNHIMNITDVGHLVSDSDDGEDKMQKGAKREGKTAWELAGFYTKAFKDDLVKLNILEPSEYTKATDNISEQIELVQILEKKGFTYIIDDGVYFDTSKLKDYGRLAKLDIDGLKEGARVETNTQKHNLTDFALWKFSPKAEKRDMEWESPWGIGFPGWHIECSAMSMKYLGDSANLESSHTFDIHCGGIDHVPVHHTNEIAQSESATGNAMANYWLHGEFLIISNNNIDEAKMSKSGNNFITLKTLEDQQGIPARTYRYFVLGAHYRSKLNFSWEALQGAANALAKIVTMVNSYSNDGAINTIYKAKFTKVINDDLNTPQALAVLWEVLKDKNLLDKDKKATVIEFDKVLGLDLLNLKVFPKVEKEIPQEVIDLADKRKEFRQQKNWQKSDELRDQITSLGYVVEDIGDNYKIII